MKKKIIKCNALICLTLILSMLSGMSVTYAADKPLVSSVQMVDDTLTVTGYSSKIYEYVDVFLINPEKTVEDLNKADTKELFNNTVNYCSVCKTDSFRKYTETITINNYDSSAEYSLYVKNGENNYVIKSIVSPKQIYVSTDGNDASGDGSSLNPYKTIDAARAAVRLEEKNKKIDVIISGGVYNVSSTAIFNENDSGTEEYPITYRAADNQRVIIKGTTALDTSSASSVTDTSVLANFQDSVKNKIIEFDLTQQGIPQKLASFADNLDVGVCGKTMGIYLNDKMQSIARWPDSGYESISDVFDAGGKNSDKTGGGACLTISNLDSERAAGLARNLDKVYAEGYLGTDWHREWAKIGSIEADGTIYFSTYTYYGVQEEKRIAVINSPYELDSPGEWYVDSDSMKLYYYPPHELTNSDKLEIATLDKNFMLVSNARYINFEGLEFAENADDNSASYTSLAGGNGITVYNNSNGINISNCTFRDIGMNGITISESKNVKINGCNFYNIGFSAIDASGGEISTLTSGGITVSNCIVSQINRDSGANKFAGIRAGGVGMIIENNILHDIPNSAIAYTGNNHIIRNNEIYNAVNEAADAGAVYAGRNFTNYGTSITKNYFHDLGPGAGDYTYFTSAVFWDDLHSGNSFTGNIVDVNRLRNTVGTQIGGGRDNVVDSNIFVNTFIGIYAEDRSVNIPSEYNTEDSESFYNSSEFQSFTEAADNVSNAYDITANDWYYAMANQFPGIVSNFNSIRNKKEYLRENKIDNNIFYNYVQSDIEMGSLAASATTPKNNLSVTDASVFADAVNKDYRFKKDRKQQYSVSDDVTDDSVSLNSFGLPEEYTVADDLKAFDLIYPSQGTNIEGTSTKLVWEVSPFADSYHYEIATDADFNNIVADGDTTYTNAYVEGLTQAEEFYWRVTASSESLTHGGAYTSEGVNRFTTLGELTVSDVSYDKMLSAISFNAVNNSSEDKTFCTIVTLKDNSGRLLDLRMVQKTVNKNSTVAMSSSASFSGAASGGVIEFYAWDSVNTMKNITNKQTFNR